MKRPLLFVLIGLVLGEAVAISLQWKGLILPVCLLALFGIGFSMQGIKGDWPFFRSESPVFIIVIIATLMMLAGEINYLRDLPDREIDCMIEYGEGGDRDSQKNKLEYKGEAVDKADKNNKKDKKYAIDMRRFVGAYIEGGLSGRIREVRCDQEGKISLVLEHCIYYGQTDYALKGMCRITGLPSLSVEEGWIQARRAALEQYPLGRRIRIEGRLSHIKAPTNPGEFDGQIYYAARGIWYSFYIKGGLSYQDQESDFMTGWKAFVKKLLSHIRLKLMETYAVLLTGEEEGLMDAIVLGDKMALSEEVRSLYEENGVAHLLAVSGLHVSIVGGTLYRALRRRGCSYGISSLFGAVLLLLYGIMTGSGSSVLRATIMYLCFLGSELLGRQYDLISAMSLSAILMLFEYPMRIRDGSFVISFVSVTAIGGVLPFIKTLRKKKKEEKKLRLKQNTRRAHGKRRLLNKEKTVEERKENTVEEHKEKWYLSGMQMGIEALWSSLVISLVTLPCILYYYYQWSPYSILLNLILIPLMQPLMVSGMAGGVIGGWSLAAGSIAIGPARLLLGLYHGILACTSSLPASLIITGCPGIKGLCLMYATEGIFFFLWYRSFDKKLLPLFGIPLAAALLLLGRHHLSVTMLDVGQGECILLMLPDGENILLDGGSTSSDEVGRYVIRPALKYYGIGKLDYVWLSHMDQDHISGIVELLDEDYRIEKICVPYLYKENLEDDNYNNMKEKALEDKCELVFLKKCDDLSLYDSNGQKLSLQCLHPGTVDQYDDRNDASLVCHLSYGEFDLLLTGDISSLAEEDMMEAGMLETFKERQLDILKVAHHGSAYSSSDSFLSLVRPTAALISVGRHNRYGHPHKETIEKLKKQDANIYRTDLCGAIRIQTNGKDCFVSPWILNDGMTE